MFNRNRSLTRVALVLMTLVLFAALLGSGSQANAAPARAFVWNAITVGVDVQTDGSAIVTEEQQIAFTGSYSFVTRVIPLNRLDAITDIAVGEGGVWYTEGIDPGYKPQPSSGYTPQGQPGRFVVTRSGGNVTIKWYFVAAHETRTFQLRYRVTGLVRGHAESDEVWWAAIGPDRGAEVRSARATITLPRPVATSDLTATAYADESAVKNGAALTTGGATYSYDRVLPEDESWTVRLFFPTGVAVAVQPVPFRNYAVPTLLSVLLPTVVVLYCISAYRRGRARVERLHREYEQPPTDLQPGLVGFLLTPYASPGAGTMFDLANHGYLTVTRQRARGRWAQATYLFTDTGKDTSDLLPYEQSVLDDLVSAGPVVGQRLQQLLASAESRRMLVAEGDRRGWYERRQSVGMGAARVITLIFAPLLAAAALCVWFVKAGFEPGIGIAIVAGVFALVALFIGEFAIRSRRTESGERVFSEWRSFGRFLRRPAEVLALGVDQTMAWLPYAVTFGHGQIWQKAMLRFQQPAPSWYTSDAGDNGADLLMADFARDLMPAVAFYGAAGAAGGGVGGASGGGGGTAG